MSVVGLVIMTYWTDAVSSHCLWTLERAAIFEEYLVPSRSPSEPTGVCLCIILVKDVWDM
jgi:hypothetical protein